MEPSHFLSGGLAPLSNSAEFSLPPLSDPLPRPPQKGEEEAFHSPNCDGFSPPSVGDFLLGEAQGAKEC